MKLFDRIIEQLGWMGVTFIGLVELSFAVYMIRVIMEKLSN